MPPRTRSRLPRSIGADCSSGPLATPFATLVARDEAIEAAEERAKALLAARGVPPEQIDVLAAQFATDLANAPNTSPGIDPHFESIFSRLCDRVEAAIAKVSNRP